MATNLQARTKKKRFAPRNRQAPFPVPISSITGQPCTKNCWYQFTGELQGDHVIVKHSGDINFLYHMGFFGRGMMSRGIPNLYTSVPTVHIPTEPSDKPERIRIMRRKMYLRHMRWKKLHDSASTNQIEDTADGDQSDLDLEFDSDLEYFPDEPKEIDHQDRLESNLEENLGDNVKGHNDLSSNNADKTEELVTANSEDRISLPDNVVLRSETSNTDASWEFPQANQNDLFKNLNSNLSNQNAPIDSWDTMEADEDFWSTDCKTEGQDNQVNNTWGIISPPKPPQTEACAETCSSENDLKENSHVDTSISSQNKCDITSKDHTHNTNRANKRDIDQVSDVSENLTLATTKKLKTIDSDSSENISDKQHISTKPISYNEEVETLSSNNQKSLGETNVRDQEFKTKTNGTQNTESDGLNEEERNKSETCEANFSEEHARASPDGLSEEWADETLVKETDNASELLRKEGNIEIEIEDAEENEDAEEMNTKAAANDGTNLTMFNRYEQSDLQLHPYCSGSGNSQVVNSNANDLGDVNTSTCEKGNSFNKVTGDVCEKKVTDDDDGDDYYLVIDDSDVDDGTVAVVQKERYRWQPVVKKDAFRFNEPLVLSFEEAYFLSYGLGCLTVRDRNHSVLDLSQLWGIFCEKKPRFLPLYAAYHFFRSKGWVPKHGILFGADLVLYKGGPVYCHATYSVIVKTVKAGSLEEVEGYNSRGFSWASYAGFQRVTQHVAKTLMICYVILPEDWAEKEKQTPKCLRRIKIRLQVINRWVSSQEREQGKPTVDQVP